MMASQMWRTMLSAECELAVIASWIQVCMPVVCIIVWISGMLSSMATSMFGVDDDEDDAMDGDEFCGVFTIGGVVLEW